MASLSELKRTLPAEYTMSNQKLIIMAHVRDETVYFYDQLGPTTTIILLTQPKCYALKKIFLEFMNDLGTTVIDLQENETFDADYEMTKKSRDIIGSLLRDYHYDYVITHPKYSIKNDSQNRAIYDFVSAVLTAQGRNNHYTYNKIGLYGGPKLPCGTKKGILELYCRVIHPTNELDIDLYKNYSNITSNISGIRRLTH